MDSIQQVAQQIAEARDFCKMVGIDEHPMPGEYLVTGLQAGNIRGEQGWHLYVGYVVQVRKKAGAFGSHIVLMRHPDGTLMRHENQCFLRLTPEEEEALKGIFPPGMTPDEYEDYTEAYTLNNEYPATGKIIEPDGAEAPPQDNRPMMKITVTGAEGDKTVIVV
jgi:hypothetical protein